MNPLKGLISVVMAALIVTLSPGLPFFQAWGAINGKDKVPPGGERVAEEGAHVPGLVPVDVEAPLGDAGLNGIETVDLNGAEIVPEAVEPIAFQPPAVVRDAVGEPSVEAGQGASRAQETSSNAGTQRTSAARAILRPFSGLSNLLRRDGDRPRALRTVFGEEERKGDAPSA